MLDEDLNALVTEKRLSEIDGIGKTPGTEDRGTGQYRTSRIL